MIGLAVMVALAMPGQMTQPVATCPAVATPLPGELAGWVAMAPVSAAGNAATAIALPIGSSVKATLKPAGAVKFARKPEKVGASGTYDGIFAITTTTGGHFRVALGAGAWIDVLKGRKALTSTAHGHGPDCSGIRKMVDFDLAPGKYTLQLSGAPEATLGVMVTQIS